MAMTQPATIYDAKILIVDDERTHVTMLERALQKESYKNIESATDPRKVRELVKSFQPDLLLLDIMMPHLDGFQVLEQLKLMEECGEIPKNSIHTMVLTARTDPETCFLAYNLGAMDFLEKPFSRQTIILRVKNLLQTLFTDREMTGIKLENAELKMENARLKREIEEIKGKLNL